MNYYKLNLLGEYGNMKQRENKDLDFRYGNEKEVRKHTFQ
jgi:hypothetical protein